MSKVKRTWHDDSSFVATWQSAGSVEEVAGNLNLMVTSVNTRARNMRKKGVPLKHFPKKARVSTVKDEAYWAAIAAEARAALPEGDEEE
jgi:hypothetical protein